MAQADTDARLRVLVVSDDPHIRQEAGYGFPVGTEVAFARDAREAWRLMKDRTPSVVLVDMQTGNAGGFGLAKDMNQDHRLQSVPVVILLERPQDAWLAKQAGAAAILTKPVAMDHLVSETLAQLPE